MKKLSIALAFPLITLISGNALSEPESETGYIEGRIRALECIYQDEISPGSCAREILLKSPYPIETKKITIDKLEDAEYVNINIWFAERNDVIYELFDCNDIPYDYSVGEVSTTDWYQRKCIPANDYDGHVLPENEFEFVGLNDEVLISSPSGPLRSLPENGKPKTLFETSTWDEIETLGIDQGDINSTGYYRMIDSRYTGSEMSQEEFKNLSCIELREEVLAQVYDGKTPPIDRTTSKYEHNVLLNVRETISGGSYSTNPFFVKSSFRVKRDFYCVDLTEEQKLYSQKKIEHTCYISPTTDEETLLSVNYRCTGEKFNKLIKGTPTMVPIMSGDVTTFVPYVLNTEIALENQGGGTDAPGPLGDSIALGRALSGFGIRCVGGTNNLYPAQVSYHYPEEAGERGWKANFVLENLAFNEDDKGLKESISNSSVKSLMTACPDGIEIFNDFVDEGGTSIPIDLYQSYIRYLPSGSDTFLTVAQYFEEQINVKVTELDGFVEMLKKSNEHRPIALKCVAAQSLMGNLGDKFVNYISDRKNGVKFELKDEFPIMEECEGISGDGTGWIYMNDPDAIEDAEWNYALFKASWTDNPFSAKKSYELIQVANNLDDMVNTPREIIEKLIGQLNEMLSPGSHLDQFLKLSRNYAEHLSTVSCNKLKESILGTGEGLEGGMLSKLVVYQEANGESDENKLTNSIDISFTCP